MKWKYGLLLAILGMVMGAPLIAFGDPDDFEEHYQRGMQAAKEGNFKEAVKELEAAYQKNRVSTLTLSIGGLYLKLGKPELAQRWCGQYLKAESKPQEATKKKAEDCVARALAQLSARRPQRSKAAVEAKPTPLTSSESALPQQPPPGPPSEAVPPALPGQPAESAPPASAPQGLTRVEAKGETLAPPSPSSSTEQPGGTFAGAKPPSPHEGVAPVPALRTPPKQAPAVETAPLLSSTSTGTPARATDKPLYKKWWLWTIVGVAAAGAAAGIAAGVILATRNTSSGPSFAAPDPFTSVPANNQMQVNFQ